MSLPELREELDRIGAEVREKFSHLVTWDKFERAAGVVEELEQELTLLGLPLGPVQAITAAVIDAARHVHGHVAAAAEEENKLTQEEITEQIALLQAQLVDPPAPPTKEDGDNGTVGA